MSSNSFYPVSPRGSGAPPDHRADTVPPTSMAGGGGSYYSGPASTAASSVMGGPANPSATYTPEEKEFHKTFPYVPLSEKVVESYQCSVSRSKVIRIGRLYLTALRMCFVSTFLKEPIHLPWDCVSSIEKKSNFLFEVVLVKRTANAIQQQSEYDLEISADQKKNSRLSKAAAKDEGGDSQVRFRASSTFGSGANAFTTANGVELNELSTGGAGEDESFTGFITGSSDAAYRMMLMLHSVRARYRRSAALEQIQSPTNGGSNPLSEGPTVNVESIENKVANLQLLAQSGILESSPLSGAASRSSTVSSQQQGYSAANTNATSPSHGQYGETPREDHDGEELALSGNGSIVDHAASTNGSTPARGTSPAAKPSTASPAAATSVATMAPLSPAKNTFSPTSPAGNATNATTSPAPSPQTTSLTPSVTPVLGPSENGLTPEFIATANHSKDMAVAARASLVTTNANEQIVLQSNLQRAMLTDEQRRKLERGHTHQRSSSMGLGSESMPGFSGEGSSANGVGASAVGGDFSQHESILKAFPLVPRTEIIVDQFQCSYAINVHRIGRLYITGNYLLFSSHFMSEPITIRLVDIERVEKFQTIMVLDGFNIHLRPEATKLTVGQIAQAGGVVPACAIRAGMMTTNPDQGMTGMPVEGSLALAEAAKGMLSPALSAATPRTELGSFGSPDVSSGRASPATSQVSRQSANSTPTLSSSSAAINAAGPPPFLAAGLPPSSPLYTSTSPAYGKAVYTFTSFVGSRDQAYGILTHFCQTHSDRVTSIAPLCPKPKDDIVVVSSPTLAPLADDSKGAAKGDSPPSAAAPLPTAMGAAAAAVDKINSNGRSWTAFRTSTSKPHFYNSVIQATSQTDISKITTDFAGGLSDLPPFLGKEGAKELMPPLKFPVGADLFDIFYHCFDDDHEILTKYHDDRRDNGQRWEVWRPHLTASSSMGGKNDNGTGMLNGLGGGQREMKSKTVIRVVGEKICDYNEFQRYAFFNIAGKRVLMVQVSGQAQGAMFSDSFRAETMMIFEEDYINGAPVGLEAPSDAEAATANPNTYFNPNRSNVCVTMKCYGYINFLRSVWVRGKILSAALTEMPECYKTLSAMMVKRVAEVMATQRAAVSATSSAAAAAGALTLALAPSSQVVEASSTTPDASAQEHDSGSAAMVPSRAMAGGAGYSTSFRESLSPHNLFSFLATPHPEGGKPKVPAFVVAPAAVILALVALYCIMCLLDALVWGSSSLPSVEVERSRLASRLSEQAAAATGVPVASQSLTTSAGDEQQLLTALAISDLYRMALRPVLVPIYGLFSLVFSSLAVEYVLVAKAELGL